MTQARRVNGAKPHRVVERVLGVAERFKRPRIACLGLAYKPDVDDLRESPALEIVRRLQEEAAGPLDGDVRVCEPNLTRLDGFRPRAARRFCLGRGRHRRRPGGAPSISCFGEPRRLAKKSVIDACGALVRGLEA